MRSHVRWWWVAVVLALPAVAVRAEEASEADPAPVGATCPALHLAPRNCAPIGGPSRTDLLVAGKIQSAGEQRGRIRIDAVFYGEPPADELTFSGYWSSNGERRVLALEARRARDGTAWALVEVADATEANLLAARALGAARLDENALGADFVWLARETARRTGPHEDDLWREVEIERVLAGPAGLAGGKVVVRREDVSGYENDELELEAAPRIFFVGANEPRASQRGDPSVPSYVVTASVGAHLLHEVQAAFGRRARYPVVERRRWFDGRRDDGRSVPLWEVAFLGSMDEALAMLDADVPGGWALAARSLLLRPDEARAPVLAAIRQRMVDHAVGTSGRHEPLQRLIRLVGRIEEGKPTGAIHALIGKYLDLVAAAEMEPPKPADYPSAARAESVRTDVNRALVWLLEALPEEQRFRHVDRLRRTRDALSGPWRREAQVAIDVLGVEDMEALLAALARAVKTLPPPVTRKALADRGDADVLVFAHHANLLALGGPKGYVRLRDPWTWTGRDLASLEQVRDLVFSSDDRHLFIAGRGDAYLQRHLLETGEWDLRYEGHTAPVDTLVLSPDGRVLASLSEKGERLLFHDAASGDLLADVGIDGYGLRPCPDGAGVQVSGLSKGCQATPRFFAFPGARSAGGGAPCAFPRGDSPGAWARSPDGRTLVCANEDRVPWNEEHPATLALYVQEEGGGWRTGARAVGGDRRQYRHLALSPDGRYLAAGGPPGQLRIHALPGLPEVARLAFPGLGGYDGRVAGLAFSPDGRVLAVAFPATAAPGLVRMDTFEKLRPWTGHAHRVEKLFFAAGGREIRTAGKDRLVCRWDARTLAPLGAFGLPAGFELTHVHPDGGLLLCQADSELEEGWPRWPRGRAACVVDAADGHVRSRFTFPPELAGEEMYWLPDPDVLLVDDEHAWVRVDLRTGRASAPMPYETGGRGGWIEEDGRHLYRAGANFKNTRFVETQRVDVETLAVRTVARDGRRSVQAEHAGLVFDGQRFWYASPGIRILDRDTCEEVLYLPWVGVEIEDVAASPDGRHLAVLTKGPFPAPVEEATKGLAASIVRIVDATTGRIERAIPLSATAHKVFYAPDGKQLVVLGRSGAVSVYALPSR